MHRSHSTQGPIFGGGGSMRRTLCYNTRPTPTGEQGRLKSSFQELMESRPTIRGDADQDLVASFEVWTRPGPNPVVSQSLMLQGMSLQGCRRLSTRPTVLSMIGLSYYQRRSINISYCTTLHYKCRCKRKIFDHLIEILNSAILLK